MIIFIQGCYFLSQEHPPMIPNIKPPIKYFLGYSFCADSERNDVLDTWFSSVLYAMREPSFIQNECSSIESYRLTAICGSSPTIVRLFKIGDENFLIKKELTGSGKNNEAIIKRVSTRQLIGMEWDSLATYIEKASFWTLPSENGKGTLDGCTFVFEGSKENKYKVIVRWVPEDNCLNLINYVDRLQLR
jgi:hypothetical protein